MKKLFALSLLAASGLIADQDNNGNGNGNGYVNGTYQDPCCPCPVDCCKPCCVPKPKVCIDCVCHTPHFYELQCDWGVSFDIEFLYWYAKEGNVSYALKVEGVDQVPTAPGTRIVLAPRTLKHMRTEWDPGFRIGLGFNSECDGWDFYLTWTYYHNKKSNSTSVANFGAATNNYFPFVGQDAIVNPWINQAHVSASAPVNTPFLFDSVSARWRFNLNWIDLELGRKYWLSPCFTMRPYTALRGTWTKTSFRTSSSRTAPVPETFVSFRDRFTTRHWSVGFLVGIQPEWYFTRHFVLYTNLDAALLWGQNRIRKHERYSTTVAGVPLIGYHNHPRSRFSKMQSIIDLAIGLRWDETWCCDRFRTALDVGWEHHIWFDTNNRPKFNNSFVNVLGVGLPTNLGFQNYDEVAGNLMFGGLVIRFRFDF